MRIRELIKSKGYNQEEFAKLIGVTRSTLLGQIERPSYTTMEKIANALNVPIWQLFISEEDIVERCSKPTYDDKSDFIALIKQGGELYSASSIAEARVVLDKLENKKEGI
ncbi:MAG: helix-turn-helix domain-containing protein [Segatella copri]